MPIPTSTPTSNQARTTEWKLYREGGKHYRIRATLRYDDRCQNGHNTFSITGEIDRAVHGRWHSEAFGCLHEKIASHFPDLAPLIKWHLCSSDGPMHYLANAIYLAGNNGKERQLDAARRTAIWSDATDADLCQEPEALKAALLARLPALLEEFHSAITSLGFVW